MHPLSSVLILCRAFASAPVTKRNAESVRHFKRPLKR
jgi:hypothetical protein